jgi:hypothetical protein
MKSNLNIAGNLAEVKEPRLISLLRFNLVQES